MCISISVGCKKSNSVHKGYLFYRTDCYEGDSVPLGSSDTHNQNMLQS